jgi:hypothetical protein
MTIIDANGAHHAGDGRYANHVRSDAADEVLKPFMAARDAEEAAKRATMAAATDAIPAVVTAFDEDIAEVHFGYSSEYGLHPTHFRDEDGARWPVDPHADITWKLVDAGGVITDYAWLTNGSPFTHDEDEDTFILSVPGTDPVGRHLRMLEHDSNWPLAINALETIRDRETVEDEDLLEITWGDVEAYGEDYVDRAIAHLLEDIDPVYNADADVDPGHRDEIIAHFEAISKAAYYGGMAGWLEAAYDRGIVDDAKFLALTSQDIDRLYASNIAPAVDRIEDRIKLNSEEGDSDS